ncbi:glucuronate isomerase [Microbacterium sp. ANT_H45B]|uniref:glucuronate isomerase n=1 Tax=Microbacterium sp. ANT_H45B TaxID=2597346 RepID=UPI0011EE6F03|nr:glucuronate isomerase [Microbacterium sp. ANT_H45B]KAA0962549.1 glucuronate isomerase [Microbacterium sp. ANT_H45B]
MLQPRRRDPDRLFPVDPRTRAISRDLYESVAGAPIISPHGHVPVEWLSHDEPFENPTSLLLRDDHYITRLLHASGVDLDRLGLGGHQVDPRDAWRIFAAHWHVLEGTASAHWLREEFFGLLGFDEDLSEANADRQYERVAALLRTPEFRPRALFDSFGIDVLATTDDPLSDLAEHDALRGAVGGRVLPTFRPDRYVDPDAEGFADGVARLLEAESQPPTFAGYLEALRARRAHFIAHGAVSADHGVEEPFTVDLDPHDADALFSSVRAGSATAQERRVFRGHMLLQMAGMSVDDGLVMTVHAGVLRNHSTATFRSFGPDSGHDIPVSTDFTRGLRPLLERFGLARDLHLVLFTVDETAYSRELAPLAGFYPSVYVGAPWWFLDAPDAMNRFRSAVTETAGFTRSSGFIDDTRAFLSIPARHDTARRADAAFLARLVGEGRLSEAAARRVIGESVDALPRRVFKL